MLTYTLNRRFIGEEYRDKEFTGKQICVDKGIELYYNKRQHSFSTSNLRKTNKRGTKHERTLGRKNIVLKTVDGYVFRDEHQKKQVQTWIKDKNYSAFVIQW